LATDIISKYRKVTESEVAGKIGENGEAEIEAD
jgi:hypothetical protein